MPITLSHHPLSPSVSPVLLTIEALGLDGVVTKKEVDLLDAGSQLHTIPSIDDDGFRLWDSHAIVTYLVDAYGKSDALYPRDPKKRAKVNQWLHFSSSILYNRLMDMTEPLWTRRSKVVSEEKSERAEDAFKKIEELLAAGAGAGVPGPWLCGDQMTLADLCCVSLVSAIEVFIGDARHYPRLGAWAAHCQAHIPGYKEVVEACRQRYVAIITAKMAS